MPIVDDWWFRRARQTGSCHYGDRWLDRYAWVVRRRALRCIWPRGVSSVLDLGCGDGRYSEWFAEEFCTSVVGVDLVAWPGVMDRVARFVEGNVETYRDGVMYDLVVVNATLATLVGNWRRVCQTAAVKGMEDRGFVVDALAESPIGEAAQRPEVPKRLLFAGRLNSNKKYRDVLGAYAKVVMQRSDVEVWVHAGTGAYAKLNPADARWHRTSERLPREEYWKLLATSHVGCYLSGDEGANVTVQEMLQAGIVMLLPRRPWVEKLFAPLQYPFTASGPKDVPGRLDWLLDHYREARQALEPVIRLIAARSTWQPFRAKFERLLDVLKAEPKPAPHRAFGDLAREMLKGAGQMRFSTLLTAWRSRLRAQPFLTAGLGVYPFYLSVREFDDLTDADPVLVWR